MTAYNLSSFAGAGAQFFDDNGNPLSGGKIYTYLAGTTTPAATYTTSAGSVANTNPIVLDAAGRTPNEIWIAVGTLFKFVLKTSTDVLIGTYDSLPPINDPYSINSLLGGITGTNTISATSSPSITAYATGATYSFVAVNSNTGAVTLSIDGLAAKNVTKNGSVALTAGDIQAGKLTWVQYDGTAFQLLNNIVYGGSITNGNIVSLTAPLSVANGGTGSASLTANNVLLGNGIAAVQTVAPGVTGNVLVSDGATWASQPFAAPVIGAFSGLKINTTSTTALSVVASYAVLGATGGSYTASGVSLTISTAVSGAGGLDTGSIANSTWYSVWIIYNGTTVSGLLSASASAPTLPSGYTYKTRVGWVRYGTGALVASIQYGRRAMWKPTSSGFPTISTGNQTQWTAVSMASLAPSTASYFITAVYNTNAAGIMALSSNSSPTAAFSGNIACNTNGAYISQVTVQGTVANEDGNVYVYSTAAGNIAYSQGWEDNL